MKRTGRRRLAVLATALAVVAGGAAAIAAGGHGKGHGKAHRARRRAATPTLTVRDLRAAAAYLGVPVAELAGALRSGESLDEVAAATPGKSAAGVVNVLTAEKRRRLDARAAAVGTRASSEASGHAKSGPGLRRLSRVAEGGSASARVPGVAAAYLGVSTQTLQRELRGRTLAEVAQTTHGKSLAGLIDALTATRRERLDAAIGAHRISPARAEAVNARVSRRVAAIVNRRFPES
jgi:hypothetical protein